MKSPCRGCHNEHVDKNNSECMQCNKRVAYDHGFGRPEDMGAMINSQGPGVREIPPGPPLQRGEAGGILKKEGNVEKQAEHGETKKSNGTKNKLIDLNDHLFMQIERLTDGETTGDKLTIEIVRSKALSQLACQIVLNARLALDAQVMINESMIKNPPKMLGSQGYDEKA